MIHSMTSSERYGSLREPQTVAGWAEGLTVNLAATRRVVG